MSEDLRKAILAAKDRRVLSGMGNVAQDLWGKYPTDAAHEQNISEEDAGTELSGETQVSADSPLEKLWRVADEPVDWTDALAYSSSPDGLTSQENWDFFRAHAGGVLKGNIDDYVCVLNKMNPLGDIAQYAAAFEITVVSADFLRVKFSPKEKFMLDNDRDVRQYFSSVAIRTARDLMALLPVTNVEVSVDSMGKGSLRVNFAREMLEGVHFRQIDPAEFVESCGGIIEDNKE